MWQRNNNGNAGIKFRDGGYEEIKNMKIHV